MPSKTLVIVVLVGAAGLAAWRFWPESGGAKPRAGQAKGAEPEAAAAASPGAASGVERAPAAPPAMPAGPVRMRSSGRQGDNDREGGSRHAMSEQFAAEKRNAEWADAREREVDARAQEILAAAARDAPPGTAQVTAGKAECREHTCRFKLSAGDTRALARALEWLGDTSGFASSAEDMLVESVEKGEDGPRVVNLFLRYAR